MVLQMLVTPPEKLTVLLIFRMPRADNTRNPRKSNTVNIAEFPVKKMTGLTPDFQLVFARSKQTTLERKWKSKEEFVLYLKEIELIMVW